MKKYNYFEIKKQFRLLLVAINEGQKSMDFDWYQCCHALNEVANAKLNINNFLDLQEMMKDVRVLPVISKDTIYNCNHFSSLKKAKEAAKPHIFPYFLWDNVIRDSKTGKHICSAHKTNIHTRSP